MPVDLRTHDPDDSIDIDPGTHKATIVRYLYLHPHFGFKPAELHDSLDIPKGSVTTTLVRLLDDGYVGKTSDGYYHALTTRDDLRRFATGLVQTEELVTRYDGFSPDEFDVTDDFEVSTERDAPGADDVEAELEGLEKELE